MSNEFELKVDLSKEPDELYLKTVYYNYFPAGHRPKETVLAEFDRAIAKIKAEAWQEGYDEFERAHNMSNYEPWEYVGDNPYEVGA